MKIKYSIMWSTKATKTIKRLSIFFFLHRQSNHTYFDGWQTNLFLWQLSRCQNGSQIVFVIQLLELIVMHIASKWPEVVLELRSPLDQFLLDQLQLLEVLSRLQPVVLWIGAPALGAATRQQFVFVLDYFALELHIPRTSRLLNSPHCLGRERTVSDLLLMKLLVNKSALLICHDHHVLFIDIKGGLVNRLYVVDTLD